MDASARATYLKQMHEETCSTIERQVQRLASKLNINKSPMVFQPGDQVWIHLRKDRFPKERKSKLLPRADGPFMVLECYNNHAYKIDLPCYKYSMSDIFNVKDLSPYNGDEEFDPRSNLSQGRGDDAEHPKVTHGPMITHKCRGSQQLLRVKYSTQIYRFDTMGAKEYLKVLELSYQFNHT